MHKHNVINQVELSMIDWHLLDFLLVVEIVIQSDVVFWLAKTQHCVHVLNLIYSLLMITVFSFWFGIAISLTKAEDFTS